MADDNEAADDGQTQNTANVEIERAATDMGWKPKDKWHGNPDTWVDAQTYYDRGQTVLPIVKHERDRANNELREVRGELATTQRLLADTVSAQEEFKKYHEETAKREYERALARLKDDKRSALKEGDADAVVEIDDAIATLKADNVPKPAAEKKAEPAPAIDPTKLPEYQAWYADNKDWFGPGKDPDRTAYAVSIAQYLRTTSPQLTPSDLLTRVTDEVNKRFSNGRRAAPTRVEGSRGGESQGRGRKTYADLPADAKEACDRFEQKLVGPKKAYKTVDDWRKQYVKDIFGDQ